MSFGENLINLRRQKGWSQDDLANNLNISRQAISKWENNTSKPDVDNIEKISKIFSLKIDELLNNELPNDKAVALDVKKEEKKEKTITIVKLMIIAVIILYAISVIYKFASLLVIVNGVQKYANLNNYHYVVTTYKNNKQTEKIESWFKNGISKTIFTNYLDDSDTKNIQIICLDFNENYGYIKEGEKQRQIDINEYLMTHSNYNKGFQLYSEIPLELRKNSLWDLLVDSVNGSISIIGKESMVINVSDRIIELKKTNILPQLYYSYDDNSKVTTVKLYEIELENVEDFTI